MSAKAGAQRKARLNLTVPANIAAAVREYAKTRNMDIGAVANRALMSYLSPGAQDERDALMANRLHAMRVELADTRKDLELLTELVKVLVELSLGEFREPKGDREIKDYNAKVARRIGRVEQRVADRFNAGETLLYEVREHAKARGAAAPGSQQAKDKDQSHDQ